VVVERCAFLDVHRDTVRACARGPDGAGGRREEVAEFGTTTSQLKALSDWLVERGVSLVGMEATGVYWKPVHWVLEEAIESVWVINARHMRNVPGRKTDVADACWGAQLLEHGLVRPSFIPPRPTREQRDLTRYRKAVIEERGREVQRLHKVLEDAGVKLSSVASSVLTRSGREMIDALIAGQRDPAALAEMAKGKMRPKIPQLRDALAGRFNEHHALLCRAMLARIDQADATIAELTGRIEALQGRHEAAVTLLVGIPGVSLRTAQVILAEIGADMSRFPTAGHLASWAGMCPGNNESAGKHRSGHTRYGSKWLRIALVEAAQAAGTLQRHLPRRALRPHPGPPGHGEGGHRRRALHLGHRLAPALHRADLRRPRRRLLRQAQDQHGPPATTRRAARSHGPQGHPGAGSLTRRPSRGYAPDLGLFPWASAAGPEPIHTSDAPAGPNGCSGLGHGPRIRSTSTACLAG
jgi:transposase